METIVRWRRRRLPHREPAPFVATAFPARPAVRGSIFPVLDGDGHGATARAAEVLGRGRPVRTFFVGLLIAYAAIVGASILLGLLLMHVILPWGGIASSDERFVVWLSHHRSSGLTDASLIGSIIAGGVVLPIVAGSVVARRRRAAPVAPGRRSSCSCSPLESAVYRATTLVVHRDRPAVPRLEQLPVNASYLSGHTAAAIAVYCGHRAARSPRGSRTAAPGSRSGPSRSASRSTSRSRACTEACTIRSTCSAVCRSGSPPSPRSSSSAAPPVMRIATRVEQARR